MKFYYVHFNIKINKIDRLIVYELELGIIRDYHYF
jgi:hypothetical protein